MLESFQSNAQRAAPIFDGTLFSGGAGSVETAAQQTAAAAAPIVSPSFSGNFVVQAQPGQSAQEVAGATREVLEEWWDSKLRTVGAP
jgi:hypothetical protein